MPKLAGYYYLSQKTQTPSCYFSILCPTLAGAYLAKLTLSFLGVNLVLESTYIGNHLTQVAPKSDMSFCSFAFGSQPFARRGTIIRLKCFYLNAREEVFYRPKVQCTKKKK